MEGFNYEAIVQITGVLITIIFLGYYLITKKKDEE